MISRAGAKPKSVTSDLGTDFQVPIGQALKAKGIEVYNNKQKENINAIATTDTAIGYLKNTLARDIRKVGTNDWASRLEQVTQGQNNNPIDEYLEGAASAQASTNPELSTGLKDNTATYWISTTSEQRKSFNHHRRQVSLESWRTWG